MKLFKFLRNILIAVIAVLFLCFVATLAIFVGGKAVAEYNQNQQLLLMDDLFRSVHQSIPSEASDEMLAPEQVGGFERTVYSSTTNRACEIGIGAIPPEHCIASTYTFSNITVWLRVWNKSIQQQTLQDMLVPIYCGAELGGSHSLRTKLNSPYIYRTCYGFMTGFPELSGIIWENGGWFIQVNGKFDAVHRFIAAYPY